jgi:hypothetical protein
MVVGCVVLCLQMMNVDETLRVLAYSTYMPYITTRGPAQACRRVRPTAMSTSKMQLI